MRPTFDIILRWLKNQINKRPIEPVFLDRRWIVINTPESIDCKTMLFKVSMSTKLWKEDRDATLYCFWRFELGLFTDKN